MKKILKNKIFVFGLVFLLLMVPAVSLAQGSSSGGLNLIPCGHTEEDPCQFIDLIQLVKNIINFAIYIMIPIGTISFLIAGWKLMWHADNPGERKAAFQIIWWVILGVIITLAAWLIVDTILDIIVNPEVFETPLI